MKCNLCPSPATKQELCERCRSMVRRARERYNREVMVQTEIKFFGKARERERETNTGIQR
jgi:hypothetical protein